MRKIKRDDEVIVIAGRDKGKRGSVRKVLNDGRLIVAGVQMIKNTKSRIPSWALPVALLRKRLPYRPPMWPSLTPTPKRLTGWALKYWKTAVRFASSNPAAKPSRALGAEAGW